MTLPGQPSRRARGARFLAYGLWALAAVALASAFAVPADAPETCEGLDPLCGFGGGFAAAFGPVLYSLAALVLGVLGAVSFALARVWGRA